MYIKNPNQLNYQRKVTNWLKIHKYNVLLQTRNKNFSVNNTDNMLMTKDQGDFHSRNHSKSSINEDLDGSINNTTVSPLIIKKLMHYTKFENSKPYISQNNLTQIMQDFTLNKLN